MTGTLHSMRLPGWLLESYRGVVGARGLTADLRLYFDWSITHPGRLLGRDVPVPYDDTITFKVEPQHWRQFVASIDDTEYSTAIRGYMAWRIANPDQPLPGDRTVRRSLACV